MWVLQHTSSIHQLNITGEMLRHSFNISDTASMVKSLLHKNGYQVYHIIILSSDMAEFTTHTLHSCLDTTQTLLINVIPPPQYDKYI